MSDLVVSRRIARHVLTKNLKVKPKETVTIDAWNHSLLLARAFVIECRRIGAFPLLLLTDETAFWESFNAGEAKQIGKWGSHEIAAVSHTDVYVYLWGPENLPRYDHLPEQVRRQLTTYNDEWYRVAKRAGVRGARLELGHVTVPEALELGVDPVEWQEEVTEAILVDPNRLARMGESLRQSLRRPGTVRIRHENGTDIELRLLGQNPRLHVGLLRDRGRRARIGFIVNLPGGAIHAALDETRAEGVFFANRPTFLDSDRYLEGRWKFHQGKLVERSFGSGSEIFENLYQHGGPGRDRPGALCIGFNPKIRNAPRAEDLEMGVILLALGYNRNLGGHNGATTFLPLTLGGADLDVGGTPVIRHGKLV
jgi:leucyl aminopeptidase (aminopeptidase T)